MESVVARALATAATRIIREGQPALSQGRLGRDDGQVAAGAASPEGRLLPWISLPSLAS